MSISALSNSVSVAQQNEKPSCCDSMREKMSQGISKISHFFNKTMDALATKNHILLAVGTTAVVLSIPFLLTAIAPPLGLALKISGLSILTLSAIVFVREVCKFAQEVADFQNDALDSYRSNYPGFKIRIQP